MRMIIDYQDDLDYFTLVIERLAELGYIFLDESLQEKFIKHYKYLLIVKGNNYKVLYFLPDSQTNGLVVDLPGLYSEETIKLLL